MLFCAWAAAFFKVIPLATPAESQTLARKVTLTQPMDPSKRRGNSRPGPRAHPDRLDGLETQAGAAF